MSLASRFTRWTYEQAKADKYATAAANGDWRTALAPPDRLPDPVDDEPDGDFDAIVRNPATGVPADVIARRAEYIATHGRNGWDRMLADVLADQAADDDPDGSAD